MAGTRTAPNPVTDPITSVIWTLHLIDASGDYFTESIKSPTDVALADVQGWANAYQAATQSSLYAITQQKVWEGEDDASNATTDIRYGVESGVNLLFKNPTAMSGFSARLAAPVTSVMQGNQDIPLLTDAAMVALILAYETLLSGYAMNSAQYTTRRERKNNPRIVT